MPVVSPNIVTTRRTALVASAAALLINSSSSQSAATNWQPTARGQRVLELMPELAWLGSVCDEPSKFDEPRHNELSEELSSIADDVAETEVASIPQLVDAAIVSRYQHHHIAGDRVGDIVARLHDWILTKAGVDPAHCDPDNPEFGDPEAVQRWKDFHAKRAAEEARQDAEEAAQANTPQGRHRLCLKAIGRLRRQIVECQNDLEAYQAELEQLTREFVL